MCLSSCCKQHLGLEKTLRHNDLLIFRICIYKTAFEQQKHAQTKVQDKEKKVFQSARPGSPGMSRSP